MFIPDNASAERDRSRIKKFPSEPQSVPPTGRQLLSSLAGSKNQESRNDEDSVFEESSLAAVSGAAGSAGPSQASRSCSIDGAR
jgi:hypothetical protein